MVKTVQTCKTVQECKMARRSTYSDGIDRPTGAKEEQKKRWSNVGNRGHKKKRKK